MPEVAGREGRSWDLVSKAKTKLEDMENREEKRLLRLQQVRVPLSFPQQQLTHPIPKALRHLQEFRETITSILGLQLAFDLNGRVRV